jgi:hypothetical protein
MFDITPNGTNRLDLSFSGKIDAPAMRTAIDALIAASKEIEHGKILYRIGDFDLPTFGALGVELSRIPELFGLIRRFDRVAVVADQAWVRKASELEGMLFPGVEIRSFERDQERDAEAWLEAG